MQVPIFWRIVSGYAVILLLFVGVSSYAVIELGGLSLAARNALDTDNRMIADEEKLTDAFLSEVRYAGQFLISHTRVLHEQFRQFTNDFTRYFSEIKSRAGSPELQSRLSRVEQFHHRYHDLFEQEVRYVRAGQLYAESRFQEERAKLFESTLQELERLKKHLQTNLHDKLQSIERVAGRARTIAAATTAVLLVLGVALSLLISRSITVPLLKLRRSAAATVPSDAASGGFHIPELRALANVLSEHKSAFEKAASANAAFSESVAEQLTLPLVSLKQRLNYLKEELGPALAAEHKRTLEILAEETERLIEFSTQFGPLGKMRGAPAATPEQTNSMERTLNTDYQRPRRLSADF